jgi:WG containing repeat
MHQKPAKCRHNIYLSTKIFKPTLSLVCLIALITFSCLEARAQIGSQPVRHLYKVRNKENKIGFIDKAGKLVIGFDRLPAGTFVGDFSEGLAPICFLNVGQSSCRSAGFIDETGEIVIPLRFKSTQQFSEGLALAESDGNAYFIDRRGEIAIKLTDGNALSFSEGLAPVLTPRGWGFIDRTGRFVSTERYTHVERFSEGLAAVATGFGRNAKYGFINKRGDVAIRQRFDPPLSPDSIKILKLGRFAEGLAPVRIGNRYGYIDTKGNVMIPPQFRDAAEFSEGLASVTTAEGKTGYIDKSGHFVIKLQSGGGYSFREGLAALAVETDHGTKVGYIDRTGKVVIEPKFDGALGFVDGVAQVYIRETVTTESGRLLETKIGYIDKAGRYLWEPQ